MNTMTALPLPAAAVDSPVSVPEPATEAAHLRRLIETQPTCLMRVGLDGVLLAVNDAALGLLGADEVGQVLGSTVTARIAPEHHEQWEEFGATLAANARASLTCDLTNGGGLPRTILFHGMPLLDHYDGIPSIILAARDITATSRLETALQQRSSGQPGSEDTGHAVGIDEQVSREGKGPWLALRTKLEEAVAEWPRLMRVLEDTETVQQETRRQLDDLQAQLDAAVAEGHRVNTLLAERDAALQRLAVERATDQKQLEQRLSQQYQQKEQETLQQLNDLRAQVQEATAARDRFEALFEESQRSCKETIAERAELEQNLEGAIAREKQVTKALAEITVYLTQRG